MPWTRIASASLLLGVAACAPQSATTGAGPVPAALMQGNQMHRGASLPGPGWVVVSGSDRNIDSMEMLSLVRNGTIARAVINRNFLDADRTQRYVGHSWRLIEEYDCEEQRSRMVEVTGYTSFNQTGRVLGRSTTPTEWTPARPGTVGGNNLRAACATGGGTKT